MYRFLLTCFLSLSLILGFSQKKIHTYKLKISSDTAAISLFDKILLIDGRIIKDNLGVVQRGAFNVNAQLIAEPSLEDQLQSQLTSMVSGSGQDGTLLLRLEKFCVAELTGAISETGYFDFTAVLFAKEGEDAYREIASIDTSLTVGGMDVTKKILNRSSEVVHKFLLSNLNPDLSKKPIYTWTQIDQYPSLLKQNIPLYTGQALQDGCYQNFTEFMAQKPSAGLVESVSATKNRIHFYQMGDKGKLKKMNPKEYYALVFNGKAYISCLGDFYPLSRKDDDYFFVGPALQTASATNVVASSLLLGAIGAAIAGSPDRVYFLQQLDFRNGSFVKIERR